MYCPNCGLENQEAGTYCRRCGTIIPDPAQDGAGLPSTSAQFGEHWFVTVEIHIAGFE
jgi:hypothetical protein